MNLIDFLPLLLLGCFTGFLAGLLGIGGGMILTPFLTMILGHAGFPGDKVVHVAIATSLATIFFTSMSSVRSHARRGSVMWDTVKSMAPGIILGSILGAQISGMLSTFWVASIFSAFVLFSAIKMILGKNPPPSSHLPKAPGLFGAGVGIGTLSSIVGAGGGFISVPFLSYCNVKMHKAIGTSAALGFPIALSGTLGYIYSGWGIEGLPEFPYMLGYIHIPAVLFVSCASVFFAPIGVKAAHNLDTKPLKRIFSFVLFALSAYMAYKAYSSL